jgi:SAM-dependent methyltransferase
MSFSPQERVELPGEEMLLAEELIRLQVSPPSEARQAEIAYTRAAQIIGLLDFLKEQELLSDSDLSGRVADLGTGAGGGVLALIRFGQPQEVVGVDDGLGFRANVGLEDAVPSRIVFSLPQANYLRMNIIRFFRKETPASFDLVTAFSVPYPGGRFPPPADLCLMVYPLLKPGGKIIISGGEMIPFWQEQSLRLEETHSSLELEPEFLSDAQSLYDGHLFFLTQVKHASPLQLRKGKVVLSPTPLSLISESLFIGKRKD